MKRFWIGKAVSIMLVSIILFTTIGCSSVNYQKALEQFQNGQYENAKTLFEQLGAYENSAEMVQECDYQIALKQMNNGNYAEAMMVFKKLGSYKDSADMSIECDYRTALNLIDTYDYKNAIAKLEDLNNYKDSMELLRACKWDLVLSKLGEKDIKFNSAIIRDNRTDEFETTIINDKGSIMMIQQQTNRNEAIVYGESMKVTVKFYMKILRDGVVEISQETFITTPSSSCTQHASGSFQAADYKKGNEVDWIHNEEAKFTLLGGRITITNKADKPTAFIASNLEKLEYQLSQIAPEVTLADLGFVAY